METIYWRAWQSEFHRTFIQFAKALSTLSQKSETVAENGDSHTFLRQSHFCATVSLFCDATVTLFCDSLTLLRCDSRTFLRQCGQGLRRHHRSIKLLTKNTQHHGAMADSNQSNGLESSTLAGRLFLLKQLQSPQLSLDMLKRREANTDCYWSFNPVHTKSFV